MAEPIGVEPICMNQKIWEINVDTDEITQLRQRYNSINDDEFQKVVETAAKIISHFPDPYGPPRTVTGLALGKVQSGKTLSFTTLIALAASNQYKIIVVLAGTKKNLLKQTKDRLIDDLELQQIEGVNNILIFPNPKGRDLYSIRGALETDRCALIVCLKNQGKMRQVKKILSSPELKDKSPVLIIDDEGDEASLNTMFRDGGQSSTYRNIVELRSSVSRCAYVAYTATPQANLLLQQIDVLHPEFCVLVEPGSGYCGGSVFFGDSINNYIRQIPDEHVQIIDDGGIPTSLQTALATFFVGGAIRHLCNPTDKHSMLIHTSSRMDDHSSLMSALSQLHDNWRDRIRLMENDPSRQDLVQKFHLAYNDFKKTVRNLPEWEIVLKKLNFELHATQIWVFNSSERRGEDEEPQFQLENNIVIGGNMLGRGVTIKNLTVTYITRRAGGESNADTMEQRARWFGYKKSYLDLCRVFMTQRLKEDYIELLTHEDDFWDSLRRYSSHGVPISEWPPLLKMYKEDIRPTRSNVASYTRYKPHGWDIMQPCLVPDIAHKNLEIVDNFFKNRTMVEYKIGNVPHSMVTACPIIEVVNELIVPFVPGGNWDKLLISGYLLRLLSNGRLIDVDVILMHGEEQGYRKRTPMSDNDQVDLDSGKINPMQGHSTNREPTDPLYYPGDRNLPNGRPQLQVHKIIYQGRENIKTCLLALFVPTIDEYNLPYYVRVELA